MAFDPDLATAHYMATLSPAAHAKATAYTQGGHWLLLWSCLATVLASLVILRSGILVRMCSRMSAGKPRRNLIAFCCALAFFVADWVLELPWSIYATWWRERSYGLTMQAFGGWLGESAMSGAIGALIAGLLMIAVYALIRRMPRSWWIWSSGVAVVGVIIVMLLAPILIEPLFNTYKPAPTGPVRSQVEALAKAAGVPSDKILIFDGSRQSERYTANVSGLFGSARIAMSDTMFKQGADIAEVRAVVGHEMGHYALHHAFWAALEVSLLATLGFWLIDRLFPIVLRWSGAGPDVTGIGDPAGLPVLLIIWTILDLLLTPVTSGVTRLTEAQADRFSMQYAHEPDGLSRGLVKTIAYRASSPSPLEEVIFYDHPSVERRVHDAMVWKAQHPDLVGK